VVALVAAVIGGTVFYVFDGGSADPYAADRAKQQSAEQQADDDAEAALEKRIAAMPAGLAAPDKKELAAKIVASAENSTLDWRAQYSYIDDIGDGNGYTAGIVGFCSGTEDMLDLVERYTKTHPGNALEPFLPALRDVNGSDSHEGLDPGFTDAWKAEAEKPDFRKAQDEQRDRFYFEPAVRQAKMDGLSTLGQFIYYDAMVLHGNGTTEHAFYGIRETALTKAKTAAEGGDETAYLNAFLDARRGAMKANPAHRHDISRIDTAEQVFLDRKNMELATPLEWKVYGDPYRVD
jgi:chitosanase